MSKLHAKSFDPLKEYVVAQTEEGLAKYEPHTINGLPLYDEEGRMLMAPSTKIPPNAMIKWLRTEYPNAATEYIRHTSDPQWDGTNFIYPMEVFECRVWLNGRQGEPDANGFSSRENIEDAEYSPLESARTSSLMNALRTLGFAVDIDPEETYEAALNGSFAQLSQGQKVSEGTILREISNGLYVAVGQDQEILDMKSMEDNNDALKSAVTGVESSPKEVKKEAEPLAGLENETIGVSDSPGTEPKEAQNTPVSDENVKSSKEGGAIFKASPELKKIGESEFVALDGAPDALKKLSGKTFAEIYKTDYPVFKAITRTGYNCENKVPEEIVSMARKILEAEGNVN